MQLLYATTNHTTNEISSLVLNTGCDSFNFMIEKSRVIKFLKKLEIKQKLRAISRNKSIGDYINFKFNSEFPLLQNKKYPYKVSYINFLRGNKSLSNTLIILENTNSLNELCKQRKKAYGTYVMVIFAGLHQPTRNILPTTYKILKAFLSRFNVWKMDLAKDFEIDNSPTDLTSKKN